MDNTDKNALFVDKKLFKAALYHAAKKHGRGFFTFISKKTGLTHQHISEIANLTSTTSGSPTTKLSIIEATGYTQDEFEELGRTALKDMDKLPASKKSKKTQSPSKQTAKKTSSTILLVDRKLFKAALNQAAIKHGRGFYSLIAKKTDLSHQYISDLADLTDSRSGSPSTKLSIITATGYSQEEFRELGQTALDAMGKLPIPKKRTKASPHQKQNNITASMFQIFKSLKKYLDLWNSLAKMSVSGNSAENYRNKLLEEMLNFIIAEGLPQATLENALKNMKNKS